MGVWVRTLVSAATRVADRPSLWLPGGLAWVVTLGWLTLCLAVMPVPSTGELTIFGAGLFTSGLWPWNIAAGAAGILLLLLAAAALVAVAEASLLRGPSATAGDVGRITALTCICAAPAVVAGVILIAGIAVVAPIEFNSPDDGAPMLRTLLRLLPILIGLGITIVVGATIHAAAIRGALAGHRTLRALAAAPALLRRSGLPGLIQAGALPAMQLAFAAATAVLLRVLWAPIEEQLALGGIDAAAALLLVGFVAIWLCLVLVGGALHATGSIVWTRVIGMPSTDGALDSNGLETPARP